MESILIGNGVRVNGRDYEIVGATGGDHYSAGGPEVFDVFDLSDYTYLEIARGGVVGNTITATYEAQGVFKLRTGLVRGENSENVEQGATLHIRPTESFLSNVPSNREHYTLTLVATDFSDFEESS
jgi:hypothetical protein